MVNFEEGVSKYLTYLRVVKNASEHTLRNYSLDLEGFKKFSNVPVLLVSSIDKRSIRAYIASLSAKSASKKTILRRLSSLRSFFKFLVKERILEHNPLDEIDSPKLEKKIPAPITYEMVERLFAQPDTSNYLGFRDRCIMELFYSSGLRISELVQLNRKDFDKKNLCLKVFGKGKKQRVVPITKTAAKWVEEYMGHVERHCDTDGHKAQVDEEAIFLNKWGTRLTVRSIDRKFEEYLKASGLAFKITPHTIRHTIATHWLEKGMDLKTIQVLLGHSCLATTTIYTQVSSRLKREVYENAHPLELAEKKEGKR
jgi:integrase/recombinase XerC